MIKRIKLACRNYRVTSNLLDVTKKAYIKIARFLLFRKKINYSSKSYNLSVLGGLEYHVFFGYHDLTPFNNESSLILACRVKKGGKADGKELLEIGYYGLGGESFFTKLGETTAWCWQMGCRLQWFPVNNDFIFFNKTIDGRHLGIVMDHKKKVEVKRYPRAIYSISPDGKHGISLNFSRLGRLRPGYGYRDLVDDTEKTPAPKGDGLWLVNMNDGKTELLVSCSEIANDYPLHGSGFGEHYFNHVLWCPDSTQFMFLQLIRYGDGQRVGRAFRFDMIKRKVIPLELSGYVSHFAWRDANEILMYSKSSIAGIGLNIYNIGDNTVRAVARDVVKRDCHPMFSPLSGDVVVADSYPQKPLMERELFELNVMKNSRVDIASIYSPPVSSNEIRCDLHSRWDKFGERVAVDSSHDGIRQIVLFNKIH